MDKWTLHFEGRLRPAASDRHLRSAVAPFSEIAVRCPEVVSVDDFYELFRADRRRIRPAFHVLRELRRGDGEAWSSIALGERVGARSRLQHTSNPAGRVPSDGDGGAPSGRRIPICSICRSGCGAFDYISLARRVDRAHAVLDTEHAPDGADPQGKRETLWSRGRSRRRVRGTLSSSGSARTRSCIRARRRSGEWLYERVWESVPPPRCRGDIHRPGSCWKTAAASAPRSSMRSDARRSMRASHQSKETATRRI